MRVLTNSFFTVIKKTYVLSTGNNGLTDVLEKISNIVQQYYSKTCVKIPQQSEIEFKNVLMLAIFVKKRNLAI